MPFSRIIVGMLWGALHFLLNLAVVITVGATILVVGLIVAAAAFWTLAWSLGKFSDPLNESDPTEDDTDVSPPLENAACDRDENFMS